LWAACVQCGFRLWLIAQPQTLQMVQRLRWSDRPDLESWSTNLASSDLGKSEFNTLLSSDLASAEKSRSSKSLGNFAR
jgi:hypothetical protein